MTHEQKLDAIRQALADYKEEEGCGCCQGNDYRKHEETLATLLAVPRYKDGSGYDFRQFRTKV
jgi:hypothetical protein